MIPGCVITALTFPGVIVHELAHELVCRLLGVRVHKACYLRLGNPPGYVVHDSPGTVMGHILIGTGPFLVNSICGAVLGLIFALGSFHSWPRYALPWLGVSIAMHSFPSTGDAKSIWRGLWGRGMPIIGRIISVPLVLVIYLGALGSVFWLDVAYGFFIAIYVPRLMIR